MMRTGGALLAFSLAALSCARSAPAPPQSGPVRLNINVEKSIAHAPLVIARDEGFFRAEGIEANLFPTDLNAATLSLASGQLDVLSAPLRSGLFNLMTRGPAVQIVADKGHHEATGCASAALIAPAATAERLQRTKSLRGERFAMVRGGTIEFIIDRYLQKNGLTLADVTIVQLPQGSNLHNDVDAIRFVTEPGLTNALRGGRNRVVATVNEIEPYQGALIVYGKRLLQDDPNLGRRFMRAYLKGVRQYNQGKTPRNVEIMARHSKLPPELLRDMCWQPIAGDGSVRPEAVQPFLDWAKKAGYLDADLPTSTWWNPSFIEAANRDLGPAR